ncbi:hypothetical protein [Nocardia sp. NPDC058705]|uniref:hypothetical protein n=1 Tax=Nocardia sp. NPDC058705 TaxID=3346609 RepID=UPI0036967531
MFSGRETRKPAAVRVAVVGAAVMIGLLGSTGSAAALPGSGSASGSADLASGSASGSAAASGPAATYYMWQTSQLIHNTLRVLLSIPMRNG